MYVISTYLNMLLNIVRKSGIKMCLIHTYLAQILLQTAILWKLWWITRSSRNMDLLNISNKLYRNDADFLMKIGGYLPGTNKKCY